MNDASQKNENRKRKPAGTGNTPRVSRQRQPADLAVDDWQRALRRQFGREQHFGFENLGEEPIFSEFAVFNPESRRRYRVLIRGANVGDNHCSCLDFQTNDLGTCKHIEFTLGQLNNRPGGKEALVAGFAGAFSEVFLDYAGQRRVRLRPGGAFPVDLQSEAASLFEADKDWQLPSERYVALPDFIDRVRATGHELRCEDDALSFIAEVNDQAHREATLAAAYPQGADSSALNELLKVDLYPYQRAGALFATRAGRALLGDEMGLGKTVQAIAAIELFARHFAAERVLVVCPTSLKHQWEREIARFSERRATVIGGMRSVRQTRYAQADFCKITNYETLSRDLDLIEAWGPDVVVVDEAQRIKNWNTVAARALKRIDSPYAVVLTGTPLENRLEELISIVQFVDQHRLGPTWRLLHEHQKRDENGRVIGYRDLDRIGQTLAPIMLRRKKAAVLEQLPHRVDNTLFMPMSALQAMHHDENALIVGRIVTRWRATGFLSDKDQRRLQCALQNMRMACDSSFLLDKETDDGFKAEELIDLLDELLTDPAAKVVIFSQWLRMHELIVRRLERCGWQYVLFHGGVPGEKRGALVDRFNHDPDCRVFLTTDAGGVGLNLQHAAATVVNMDLPWNPAVLEQRIGRVHRLGQTRGVQVINFVARGTIEESMLSVLAFKKSLAAGILDGGDSQVTLQGTRLSKFMETVDQVTGSLSGAAASCEDDGHDTPPLAAIGEATLVGEADGVDEYRAAGVQPATAGTGGEAAALPGLDVDAQTGSADAAASTNAASASSEPVSTAHDPWAPLLAAGAQVFGELLAASRGERESSLVHTDPTTGERFLKLPVPDPASVQKLAEGLLGLLAGKR